MSRSLPDRGDDPNLRTIATHVLTALVTLTLVMLWLGGPGRRGAAPAPPAAEPASQPGRTHVAVRPTGERYDPPTTQPPPVPEDVLKRVDADEQINIRVYEAVNRSVVNITVASEAGGAFNDEITSGSGSGFVLDKQGHILTNNHVVEGAEVLQVTLFDGSNYAGEVIGTDPPNDVAVVRIKAPADKLVPVALGDSSHLVVGQKVLALGNPFGLERTLTVGIISALDRSMKAKNHRTIKGVIQTDAAINPGNSGGPLLNTRGEVIGINTAIISQVGQSAGIGFAVPISAIKRILKPLIEEGHVTRADIGVKRVFTTDQGLFIVEEAEGGAAEQAGLRPLGLRVERVGPFYQKRLDPESADLIVAIDGKPVRSVEDLLTEVEARAPGDTVTVTVIRGGQKRDVKVKLGRS
jgi:S1-C subfamily serine protease